MLQLRSVVKTVALVQMALMAATAQAQQSTRAWVVEFVEPGLLENHGQMQGFEATAPIRGEKLDSRSLKAQRYVSHLRTLKDQRLQDMAGAVGHELKPRHHYRAIRHGLLVDLTDAEAAMLRSIEGVASITPEPVYEIDTERGPAFIGAMTLWDGTDVPNGLPHQGEGLVVASIDTGINSDHPAFAEVGPIDGYVHVNPLGDGNSVGHCIGSPDAGSSPNPPIQCNNKLIGAWMFGNPASDPTGPEDSNGHGTHTASTAAGNFNNGPFWDGGTQSAIDPGTLSGVAPHANIISYDVCETNTCSATSAGIDQAILDSVDVINFSISGGNNPWTDNDRRFLTAVSTGIYVAASAGNTRDDNPNPEGDVAHLGPWVMTVANSSHDRNTQAQLTNMSGGTSAPADMIGSSLTGSLGASTVVYAGDFSNGDPDPEQCLNPFPAGTWNSDEIVLCDRGQIARVLKGVHAAAGGAAGLILANVDGGADSVVGDFHVIPGIHVDAPNGNMLRSWLASGTGHTASITGPAGSAGNPAVADIINGSSLRGPNLSFDVTKPDITGPGTSIMAAYTNDANTPAGSHEVSFLSGTSMSSPHLAGSGALIMQIHPDWTVSEVKSAIQMTAVQTTRMEDGTTPATADVVGNGRAQLDQAAQAGLVMDETIDNYIAANPATGGDPRTLNIPSVRNTDCSAGCSWTRTVRNVLDGAAEWNAVGNSNDFTVNVTPANFDLLPGDVLFVDGSETGSGEPVSSFQTITITASGVTSGNVMAFGDVILSEAGGQAPNSLLTVAVSETLPPPPP
jgi:subtilisin family serine protease